MVNLEKMMQKRVAIMEYIEGLHFRASSKQGKIYASLRNNGLDILGCAVENNITLEELRRYINYFHRLTIQNLRADIRNFRTNLQDNGLIQQQSETNNVEQQTQSLGFEKIIIQGVPFLANIDKYSHNMCVGFEFECKSNDYESSTKLSQAFGIKYGRNYGKQKIQRDLTLIEGDNIRVPVMEDLYKRHNHVVEIYRDHSVGDEVVTRPIQISKIDDIKYVFDKIKEIGKMKVETAGLHMTFLLDQHKELSKYDPDVVRNIIQLIRIFYPAIVVGFRQTRRPLRFRRLPENSYVSRLNCSHNDYYAVAIRREQNNVNDNSNIWALEIRLPDGTDDWNVVKEQVIFYSALIRHAAKLSKYGRITFSQLLWNENNRFFQENHAESNLTNEQKAKYLAQFDILKKIIKDEIDYFTYQEPLEFKEEYYTR